MPNLYGYYGAMSSGRMLHRFADLIDQSFINSEAKNSVSRTIGETIVTKARYNVKSSISDYGEYSVPFSPLQESTYNMRYSWLFSGKANGNVMGDPLNFTGDLENSITYKIRVNKNVSTVTVGVYANSEASAYAAMQEYGGTTSPESAIPNKPIPARPFLAPAVIASQPEIQKILADNMIKDYKISARALDYGKYPKIALNLRNS